MNSFGAFLLALQLMESGGNYSAVNTLNFLGAYQFGEAALIDLGFVRSDSDPYDNNFGGGWTGKYGINSKAEFLASKTAQDRAVQAWLPIMWSYIEMHQIEDYAWSTVGGVELTPSGMLAASHLLGAGALKEYIESEGRADLRDPYGMPLSNYIERLNGYTIPFAPRPPRGYQIASNS